MYMLTDRHNDNDRSHFQKFFLEKEAKLKIQNENLNLSQRIDFLRVNL